jgi:L-ribulose-5-phosphate 3-epimerase
MTAVGIMQGRLSPPSDGRIQCFPRDTWAEEVPRAAAAGLASIEWIYDMHGEDVNPLATEEGTRSLRALGAHHGVALSSVCADYFMERPLVRCTEVERSERIARLEWLIGRCRLLGARYMVLPFVDNSAINGRADEDAVVASLRAALPAAEAAGVGLQLETALDPAGFRALLGRLDHPLVSVNYDIGNSASLGFAPREELAAYGTRIGSVHIKDRVLNGSTVPLGTGSADFSAVFSGLRQVRYDAGFILQVARGASGDEVAWARQNREWVQRRWNDAGGGAQA